MVNEPDPYLEIARIVGDVCLHWSDIEEVIRDISLHLAAYLDRAFDEESALSLLLIPVTRMDIRGKIATAKALAHLPNNPKTPDLYDHTACLLNYIDNELRNERNRYIHDAWRAEGAEVARVHTGPRVSRPQARERVLSISTERRYQSLAHAAAFIETLKLAYDDLVTLDNHIAWMTTDRDSPGEFRQPLPQEWKSLAHRGWQGRDTPEPLP